MNQLLEILEKKDIILRDLDNPRVRALLHSGFKRYVADVLVELYNDIEIVSELKDNTTHENVNIIDTTQRVNNILNDLKNIAILNPVTVEFHTFIKNLTVFFANWNNIYNTESVNININSLLTLSQLIDSLPVMLEKLQRNSKEIQRIADSTIRNNPLAYKASAIYLKSIKRTFEKKEERDKK